MIFPRFFTPKRRMSALLHCHLFKNAGSTIDWSLRRSFARGFVDHRLDKAMIEGGMDYVEQYLARRNHVAVLSSHHMPFDPEFRSGSFPYWHIIMLRHPIARTVSVYQFEKTQPAVSLGARMAKKLDMCGYFEWRMQDDTPVTIRNFHSRYLAGRKHPECKLQGQDFDRAIMRARLPNVLVGFVERFDESMVLFESILQGYFQKLDLAYVKQNQNHSRPEDSIAYLREELGEPLFLKLNENNNLDLCLYEVLAAEFETRIGKIGDFQQRLAAFKDRCALLHA